MPDTMQPNYFTRGWSFPPQFGLKGSTVQMAIDQEDIQQSLTILLFTLPGERFMHPTYGADVKQFLFQEMSQGFITHLKEILTDAITRYEPRIKVDNISVLPQDNENGELMVNIQYTILATLYSNVFSYILKS